MGGEVSHKGLLVQMKNRLKQWSCGSGSVWVQMTCDPQSLFLGKRQWMDDIVVSLELLWGVWQKTVVLSVVIALLSFFQLFFSSIWSSLLLFALLNVLLLSKSLSSSVFLSPPLCLFFPPSFFLVFSRLSYDLFSSILFSSPTCLFFLFFLLVVFRLFCLIFSSALSLFLIASLLLSVLLSSPLQFLHLPLFIDFSSLLLFLHLFWSSTLLSPFFSPPFSLFQVSLFQLSSPSPFSPVLRSVHLFSLLVTFPLVRPCLLHCFVLPSHFLSSFLVSSAVSSPPFCLPLLFSGPSDLLSPLHFSFAFLVSSLLLSFLWFSPPLFSCLAVSSLLSSSISTLLCIQRRRAGELTYVSSPLSLTLFIIIHPIQHGAECLMREREGHRGGFVCSKSVSL